MYASDEIINHSCVCGPVRIIFSVQYNPIPIIRVTKIMDKNYRFYCTNTIHQPHILEKATHNLSLTQGTEMQWKFTDSKQFLFCLHFFVKKMEQVNPTENDDA